MATSDSETDVTPTQSPTQSEGGTITDYYTIAIMATDAGLDSPIDSKSHSF